MKVTRKNLERLIKEEMESVLIEARLIPAGAPMPPKPPTAGAARLLPIVRGPLYVAGKVLLALKLISASAAAGYGIGTVLDKATGASDAIGGTAPRPDFDPSDSISSRQALENMDYETVKKNAVLLAKNLEEYYKEIGANSQFHADRVEGFNTGAYQSEGDLIDIVLQMREEVMAALDDAMKVAQGDFSPVTMD